MDQKMNAALSEPFSPTILKVRTKGGSKLTYASVAEVIARLNLVLGTEGWGEDDANVWISAEYPGWVLAKVTLSLVAYDQLGARYTVTKIGYGGEDIKFYGKGNNEGKPLDLGDAYKGAHSDAFKKAATQMGVGLHLAREDEAMEEEDEARLFAERAAAPKASEADLKEISEKVAALDADQKKTVGGSWRDNGIPSLQKTPEALTVAHIAVIKDILANV